MASVQGGPAERMRGEQQKGETKEAQYLSSKYLTRYRAYVRAAGRALGNNAKKLQPLGGALSGPSKSVARRAANGLDQLPTLSLMCCKQVAKRSRVTMNATLLG